MTFLCFLGALQTSSMALRMGPTVLFKVYSIALNTKIRKNHKRSLLTVTGNLHMEMISVTQHLKRILTTLAFTAVATGSGYEIIIVVQYVLWLILHIYDLLLHLSLSSFILTVNDTT